MSSTQDKTYLESPYDSVRVITSSKVVTLAGREVQFARLRDKQNEFDFNVQLGYYQHD